MKKLDKLILGAYLGPFLVSLPVVVFIFLVQLILKYIDELVGKDIGIFSFLELCLYFSMNLFPTCLPLAVLLGSLIAFGNLGEHNELTAIKSAGISLVRILMPAFILVLGITIFSFWFNNSIVPKVNLKAYALLYDLRHKKPALDIREGVFYNGLPGYIVKVAKKFPDGKTLKGVMIYNHTQNRGNTDLIAADSGIMYTFHDEKYLALELFNGANYSEYLDDRSNTLHPRRFVKTDFYKTKIVFALSSFALKKTEEGLFKSNRQMKDIDELQHDIDSFAVQSDSIKKALIKNIRPLYTLQMDTNATNVVLTARKPLKELFQLTPGERDAAISRGLNQARSVKSFLGGHVDRIDSFERDMRFFNISWHQKFTQAAVCLLFFIIGAPLGAIIKKGGLGVPMIVCISFFVIYYIISMVGEKYAKETDHANVPLTIWSPIFIMLPIGLFFLRQARNDSRVFDPDIYKIYYDRLISKFKKSKTGIDIQKKA